MSLQSCLWIVPADISPLIEGLFQILQYTHARSYCTIVHPLKCLIDMFFTISVDFLWFYMDTCNDTATV